MEYLKTTDLNAQELGKVKLQGDETGSKLFSDQA